MDLFGVAKVAFFERLLDKNQVADIRFQDEGLL